jgi:hypothetical protein
LLSQAADISESRHVPAGPSAVESGLGPQAERPVAETLRLRTLQRSPHVERLLEALVVRANLVPEGAHRIRQPASVPRELRRIAAHASEKGRVWSCWVYGFRSFLFTGEMSLPLSRERGVPVMLVDLYDAKGLKDSAPWMPDPDGKWRRCEE